MNMDRIHHSGTRLSDPPTAANEPSPGAPQPITKHSGRTAVDSLSSSGRRHPPDRQRPGPDRDARRRRGGSRRATGADAASVTWLVSDPAGRLLTGLVQVGFVAAAAGAAPSPCGTAGPPAGRPGGRGRAAGAALAGILSWPATIIRTR